MTKIFLRGSTGSDFEKQVLAYFKEYAFLLPKWCRILNVQIVDEDASGSCSPVMHNGFATITIGSTAKEENWVRDTVIHEIAHLYTFPDIRFVLTAVEELDIAEDTYKILKSAAMDRHESCTDALTTLFEEIVAMKKSCGTKKGAKGGKPFPPKGK